MCGRYRLSRRKQIIAEHFDATPFDDDWIPRYNIAPTQVVPVIRQIANTRELSRLRCGLVPSWARDPRIGFKTINAKSETIRTEPSFRDPIRPTAASSQQTDSRQTLTVGLDWEIATVGTAWWIKWPECPVNASRDGESPLGVYFR